MTTPQLPPLPETTYGLFYEQPVDVEDEGYQYDLDEPGYTADQMRAYALAALSTRPVHGDAIAHLWQHTETGRTKVVMPDEVWTASNAWAYVGPLVLGAPTPPAQPSREPMTEDQPGRGDEGVALLGLDGPCASRRGPPRHHRPAKSSPRG